MSSPLRLRGPAELAAVLPYQLGYHPTRSLVVVAFHGTSMGLVQRIDLPGDGDEAVAAQALLRPLLVEQPSAVVLFGYEQAQGQAMPMLDAVAPVCGSAGVQIRDRLVVRAGRWFAPDCHDACCPGAGTALAAPADLPVVAEFVGREIAPLPDRVALEDGVRLRDAARGQRIAALAETLSRARVAGDTEGDVEGNVLHGQDEIQGSVLVDHRRRRDLLDWREVLRVDHDATPVEQLPEALCARLAVSLEDVGLRDALVSWLCPGSMPAGLVEPGLREQLETALEQPGVRDPVADSVSLNRAVSLDRAVRLHRTERRLVDLCACLDDDWAVAPLTVLGAFAWWRGDGALGRIALERALSARPGYRLALLLEQMVDLAIRPDRCSA